MTTDRITAEYIIIGGGIAGASAGYELSKRGKVIILEKENQPGYHTTGRSSAIFQKSYQKGDPLLHKLVMASEDFLSHPPAGFTPHKLLKPRPMIYIASRENQEILDEVYDRLCKIDVAARFINAAEATALLPVLAPDYHHRALYEDGIADIDVNALHEGYLRAMKSAGGEIITKAEVTGLTRQDGKWQVASTQGKFEAPIIINAAGAWVDEIAHLAGLSPINIQPLRRTVIMVSLPEKDMPQTPPIDDWPLVMDYAEGYYFKPDSGKILMTPGDEKLSPPADVQPEEIDIAYGAHYLESATTLKVHKIDHSWAGLRNHVADGHPVVGFDAEKPGFFWLAAQGGFGIKTSPAMGRITASLILGQGLPQDISQLGLKEEQISLTRLKKS